MRQKWRRKKNCSTLPKMTRKLVKIYFFWPPPPLKKIGGCTKIFGSKVRRKKTSCSKLPELVRKFIFHFFFGWGGKKYENQIRPILLPFWAIWNNFDFFSLLNLKNVYAPPLPPISLYFIFWVGGPQIWKSYSTNTLAFKAILNKYDFQIFENVFFVNCKSLRIIIL